MNFLKIGPCSNSGTYCPLQSYTKREKLLGSFWRKVKNNNISTFDPLQSGIKNLSETAL